MSVLRKIGWIALAGAGSAIVGLAVIYGGLQTDPGRRLAASAAERGLAAAGIEARIGSVEEISLSRLRVARISLGAPDSPWLTLSGADLDWQPFDLLTGTFTARSLKMAEVDVLRAPPPVTAEDAGSGGLSLPLAISVDRFGVGILRVDESVAGVGAVLGIDGEASAREDGVGSFRLEAYRRDGAKGDLSAEAVYALETRRLDLKLSLNEPAGGVLAGLLDIPGRPPVSATLNGTGSLDGWRGWFSGSAGDGLQADARIELALADKLTVKAEGSANIVQALPEPLRRLVGPDMQFAADLTWDDETRELGIDKASISGEAGIAEASGVLNLESSVLDGRVSASLTDSTVIGTFVPPVQFALADADATVRGSLDGGLDVEGTVQASSATLPDARMNGLIGESPRLGISARLLPDGTAEISSAILHAAAGTVSLSGHAGPGPVTADLAVSAEIPDLSVLEGLLQTEIGGMGTVSGQVRVSNEGTQGSFAADVRELSLAGMDNTDPLLPKQMRYSGDFATGPDGGWTFDKLALDADGLTATGRASLSGDAETLAADYSVRLADTAKLSGLVGTPLSGPVTLDGKASGPLASPNLTGSLASPSLTVAGTAYEDVSLGYKLQDAATRPRGTLDGRLRHPWGNLTLRSVAELTDGDRLALREIDLQSLGGRLTGALDVDLTGPGASGKLALTLPDLEPLSPVLEMPLAGRLDGTVVLGPRDGVQDVTVEIAGKALRQGEDMTVEAAQGRLTLRDLFGQPDLDGAVRLSGITRDDQKIALAEASARGTLERLDVSARLDGGEETPVTLQSTGWLSHTPDRLEAEVSTLSGVVFGQEIALADPARFERSASGRLAVENATLSVGGGQLSADMTLDPKAADLDLRLRALPLALILPDQDLSGTLDGDIRLSGPPEQPDGTVRLETSGAKLGPEGETTAVGFRGGGKLASGILNLEATLQGPEGAALSLSGAQVPLRVSIQPFGLEMAGDAKIAGTLSGGGDLALLAGPLLGDTNRIGGRLDIQATLSGTVGQPRAEGTARIFEGRYENILTGTTVRDIAADIRIRNARLDIVSATGKAGSGDVSLTGGLDLLPEDGFPLDLALRADKASVVERDEISATASGDIALEGPVDGLTLSGAVTVDTAEVKLIENMPPEVVTLDVTEVNGDGPVPAPPAGTPKASSENPITLDLTFSAPGRFFIRGRGLESEWQGQVKIEGTSASPAVSGQMSPIRGVFSFAGKNFDLDSGSSVAFRDPDTLMPVVDLIAKYSGKAMTAQFRLQGPADDPKLSLSSTPSLPEDEIVSQLLFGRGVARISAVEAAQLAQALATLSGMGGPGLLDTVRQTLGIDVLRVDAGESGSSPSVAAGRYLGEGVYVGVNQGTGAKSGEAKVEVEVTPNITVETEVGPETGGRLGARWKLDY